MPRNSVQKNTKKKVTEQDIAETRAKIMKAAGELEQQIDMRFEKIKDWRKITASYPLEIATALFTAGFFLGSGILREIISMVLSPKATAEDKAIHQRSTASRLSSLIMRPVSTFIVTSLVLDRLKKRAN
jgi:hypothetical protein